MLVRARHISQTAFSGRRAQRRLPFRFRDLLAGAACLFLMGCATMSGLPPPVSTEERLGMIPLTHAPVERPVTIHWSREQIPFIEAETDRDAAFALGLVHAHLRLGQLEMMRRISQGRLSEIAGPIPRVRDLEHALRIIDLGRTSEAVYAAMPADSKAFLDAFVAGLNHYQQNTTRLPHEFALLGIAREPWTAQEILTLGRLASVDITWLVWFRLMPLRDRPDWPALWAEALRRGTASAPSLTPDMGAALKDLTDIFAATARAGSNSFAVGGGKTRSGAAIIASDPHLGVTLPNLWLLAGFKSPSYHAVGFMIPGLPFVAVGRNPDIAWGGTNLRSAASDLIDVSSLPPEAITTRMVSRKVRWWFDGSLPIRDTPYGPLISDAALIPKREGEMFALKWIGHLPSDEFTAMLGVNRAKNWDEFRLSLEPFAISAQNFIYADRFGNIGQLTTTHLPRRSPELPADIVRPLEDAKAWESILTSRDLPKVYNPARGFVASGNNKPAETPYPIGYFFSGDDRVLRMHEVLSAAKAVTVEDAARLQRDTYMSSAARLRDAIAKRGRELSGLAADARGTLEAIAAWDGRYDADSKGAVAFQATVASLIPNLFSDIELRIIGTGGAEYITYAEMIEGMPDPILTPRLSAALAAAQSSIAAYPTWGDMHVLGLRHTFGAIPVVGRRYRFAELPWPGSSETLWRAAHGLSAQKVFTGFGAQARHISDMADADSNWFALLGGNDGWLNSENFLDQVEAFRTGGMIQVPLKIESVRARFPYKTTLTP